MCSRGGGVSTSMRRGRLGGAGKDGAVVGHVGGGPVGSGAIHRGGGGLAARRVQSGGGAGACSAATILGEFRNAGGTGHGGGSG